MGRRNIGRRLHLVGRLLVHRWIARAYHDGMLSRARAIVLFLAIFLIRYAMLLVFVAIRDPSSVLIPMLVMALTLPVMALPFAAIVLTPPKR